MEIYDEYTQTIYLVPPEEETLVIQLQQYGATTPEIVEALSIPAPEAAPPEVVGYLPSADGFVVPIEEIPELREEISEEEVVE